MISTESRLFRVDVIVLDEVHYLSDISRGTVWEEIVCKYLILSSPVINCTVKYWNKVANYHSNNTGYILSEGSPAYMSFSNSCKS